MRCVGSGLDRLRHVMPRQGGADCKGEGGVRYSERQSCCAPMVYHTHAVSTAVCQCPGALLCVRLCPFRHAHLCPFRHAPGALRSAARPLPRAYVGSSDPSCPCRLWAKRCTGCRGWHRAMPRCGWCWLRSGPRSARLPVVRVELG